MWLLALLSLTAVVAETIVPVTQCPAGSNTVFLMQHNATIGKQLRTIPAPNMADCSDHCSLSTDCVGIEYSGANCRIFEAGTEKPTPNSRVLMKSCVKSDRVCSSPFHFDVFEQKILVGFAREVVPADNIQTCMAACLNSFDTFGFECESVMYYPVDQECILNTEDRLDRPDLFVDEADDTVVYMDNNCAGCKAERREGREARHCVRWKDMRAEEQSVLLSMKRKNTTRFTFAKTVE